MSRATKTESNLDDVLTKLRDVFLKLDFHIKYVEMAEYAKIGANAFEYRVRNRIETGEDMPENAEYTLFGDEDTTKRDFGYRRSVHNNDEADGWGKAIVHNSSQPLVESGNYLNAMKGAYVPGMLGQYRIGLNNEHAMKVPSDAAEPLWEVLEYGTANIPPRAHVYPAMKDAAEDLRKIVTVDLEERIKDTIKKALGII